MASFIEFVIIQHGVGKLRQLWDAGYAGCGDVFGKEAAAVEKEWHTYLTRTYQSPEVPDWPDLRENGCK
jgi:hypothetical protein